MDFTPEDPYTEGLKKLRAAGATPASTFEEQHKAARLRELDAEHAEIYAHIEANPFPRLTAAEEEEFAPPDIYAAGIRALQEENRRAESASSGVRLAPATPAR